MASFPAPSTVPPNRRRDKAQLSCTFCRQKKLRCDRQRPCQSCVARGIGLSCTYPPSTVAPSRRASRGNGDQSSLVNRLKNLEGLLTSLINANHGHGLSPDSVPVADTGVKNSAVKVETTSPDAETPSQVSETSEPGSMRISSSGTVYVSSNHWSSILDGISDIRDCIEQEMPTGNEPASGSLGTPDTAEGSPEYDEPHLFSGCYKVPNKMELLRALPERQVVDRHIFWYFNSWPHVHIHAPSFLRKYEEVWSNPAEVPIMWLGILYSILCLTTHPFLALEDDMEQIPDPRPMYLEEVIQCLILGDYSRGGPYTLEALFNYFMFEHARRRDADVRNWTLFGVMVRLALRMGYHRDPAQFPTITTFEGEMRRRQWMLLFNLDVLFSVQMGMPRLIKDDQIDTKSARNLADMDFDEDTVELPPSRADSDPAAITIWGARHRIMKIMAKIADMVMSLSAPPEDDPCSSFRVRQLDSLLRAEYDSLSPTLKFTSLAGCLDASPESIGERVTLAIMLQKGLILLHRRHAIGPNSYSTSNSPVAMHVCSNECHGTTCVAESARVCIDAALKVLEYHDFIYREIQPGGALAPLKWRLVASTISHEFLMATSVLCKYLYRISTGESTLVGVTQERIQAIKVALVRAYEIWKARSARSRDAKQAADTLGVLMERLNIGAGVGPGVGPGVHAAGMREESDDAVIDQLMAETQAHAEMQTSQPQVPGMEPVMDQSFYVWAEGLNDLGGIPYW